MSSVQIKFDANQNYQLDAVNSVVSVLDGLSKYELEERLFRDVAFEEDDIVPNIDTDSIFTDDFLLENVNRVRALNHLNSLMCLSEKNDGDLIDSFDFWSYPEFTIDMETGTGKTYVYLRTIYSLFEKYGFRKFIIVVPSIAIYEGVLNTFKATRNHFLPLFSQGAIPTKIIEYDGEHPEMCKNFATSTTPQILLTTIDSFNKAKNTIFKQTDKLPGSSLLPIHYIQKTRPILILDESQKYGTDKAKKALRTLKPLFAIRYSATPGKNPPNELYRLSPFDALQMNLVKRIAILGSEENQSGVEQEDYFKVIDVRVEKKNVVAELQLQVYRAGKLHLEKMVLKNGDVLSKKTKNEKYGDLKIKNLSAEENQKYVEFSNGLVFANDEESCASLTKEQIFRKLIRDTIQTHIERKRFLEQEGCGDVKVLSLFFVDRVASYNGENPIIKNIFDEEFNALKSQDSDLARLEPKDVREAYFAQKVNKKTKVEEAFDIDEDCSADDKEAQKKAFDLIMRKKEVLLSKTEKVCFIFAHSALREGWDNPNVFQICALREISTENSRRQTIGRGLRLPVNQNGERLHNPELNVLTVIANESYESYAAKLQLENAECGASTGGINTTNARKNVNVVRNKNFGGQHFKNLWENVCRQTEYEIRIDSDELIDEAKKRLDAMHFEPAKITTTKGRFVVTRYVLEVENFTSSGNVTCSLKIENSEGDKIETKITLKEKMTLAKAVNNELVLYSNRADDLTPLENAKAIKIEFNEKHLEYSTIQFDGCEEPLSKGSKWEFSSETGRVASTVEENFEMPDIPKFDLLARTAKETNLTRKTILRIFKNLSTKSQVEFLKNPEGFAGQFIAILKELVSDHIARKIRYSSTGGQMDVWENPEELFPQSKKLPENEVETANESVSIYNKIQVDSSVERNFVIQRLNVGNQKSGKVQLYFKFPPKYKIAMPKIIGNYNPDWAIVRNDANGSSISVVRETKGTEDLRKLPHTNEARKIICAQQHFKAINVEYRHVDDRDDEWYKPYENPESVGLSLLGEDKSLIYEIPCIVGMVADDHSNPYKA